MSTLGSSEFSSIHLSLSWLNAVLYMLEIILAAHYLSHFDTKRPLKALLFIMLLADTICMTTIFASTWLLIIKGPQSYSINESRWTVLLSALTITTVSVIEEVFLINRCRRLAQHTAITLLLFALVITHAIFNIYSGFYVVAFPEMASTPVGFDTLSRRYGSKSAAVAASVAATVDVLVPLALSWRLYRITPAAVRAKRSWRDTLVNTISFGGVGGVMGVVLLILFWVRPDVFYVLSLTMGRVYVITLLVNLILSFSAEMMMTFTMPRLAPREKQLPPTPIEVEEV